MGGCCLVNTICSRFHSTEMPDKCAKDTCDNERQEHFIHIEDLPWLAYQQDIRDFFQGLPIKEDGILIRHFDAFVAFEKTNDIDIAISQKDQLLLGNKVKLKIVTKDQIRRLLYCIARRKLDFGEKGGDFQKYRSEKEVAPRRKIRPTPVIRGKKRKVEPCSIFCPIESDCPPPVCNRKVTAISWDIEYFPCKKKKIQPIRLSDSTVAENFLIFHPEECYEYTRMLIDV